MRPFLVLGLGGSGGKTIRYLKQSLHEWLREVGWSDGIPQAWQFLHIDTPQAQDSPVLPGSPELLPPNEYLSLHRDGVPFSTVVDRLQRAGTDFDGWWVDPDYMTVPIANGAGQYRAIGRILGLDQQTAMLGRIQGKIAALHSSDSYGQLSQLRAAAQGSGSFVESSDPVVMVVSSLAGGTGAGLFMDIADMLRAEGEQWLDNSIGILYAADVFRTLASGAQAGVHPNTAAALAELMNGVYAGGSVTVAGDSRQISRSGPAFPFLVGHANTKGVVFGDQTDVYRVMGRCLSAVMTDPKVQDDFVVYTAANWMSAAGSYGDGGGPRHMLMEPPYRGILQGLGYAEVDLGIERFKTYAERRMARDAIEVLIDGHRLYAVGSERFEGLPPEAIAGQLAEDRLTSFLNRAEINERGPENNQIIDAIALSIQERQITTGRIAEEIYNAVRDQIGTKAKADDWIDAIVEQAELVAPRANEIYDGRLRERARTWTEQITGRLTTALGAVIADLGLQVASDLIALVASELDHIAEELEQERLEFEGYTAHARSNVQAVFGEMGGQVGSDHDTIARASSVAVEALVYQRMEEKSRFIARELVKDLNEAVIRPLAEAVRYALGDLQRKLRPDDVESALIDGWPRHLPQRDQAVPDDLIPGKTVALVIEHETFPGLFDELLAKSLGNEHDAIGDRWREVRHRVVTGDFLEDSATSKALDAHLLFETVAKWQPKEAILLGGDPDRPARFKLRTARDEVVARAQAWMHRDGSAFNDFLGLGLRSYLQEPDDKVDAAAARAREAAFQKALDAAFQAAEPLVNIDPVRLTEIHGRSLSSHVVPGEIPLKNHRLERWVIDFLDSHIGASADGGHDNLTQDGRVHRISIYSMLDGALHPAVFKSINEPIADGYRNAMSGGKIHDFWKWRRSRPLARAIPLPMPLVRALIRGWFVARVLGLLTVESSGGTAEVVLRLDDRAVKSTPLVSAPGSNKPRELGAFLETLALSIPYAADAGQAERMLAINSNLIEFGRSTGATGATAGEFRELSSVLEQWVVDGTVFQKPAQVPTQLVVSDGPGRARALADLFGSLAADYDVHADQERSEGRISPDNAWLGASPLIREELHRLELALRQRAAEKAPEF